MVFVDYGLETEFYVFVSDEYLCVYLRGRRKEGKKAGDNPCGFSSVARLCSILCDPMDCSTPGFPVLHQLLELVQTHVHQVGHRYRVLCIY